jgi:Tfp pilus assembly protein PilF
MADAHAEIAAALLESSQYAQAVPHLQAASAQGPAHTLSQVLIASCMRDATLLPEAINRFKRIIKSKPREFTALNVRAT